MCQTLTGQQAERSCRERGSGGKLLWFHSGSVMLVLHTSCNFFFFPQGDLSGYILLRGLVVLTATMKMT